jgi:hypothetical protein
MLKTAWLLSLLAGPLLYALPITTDFENGFGPWVPFSEGTWEIQEIEGNHVAALTESGSDRPPVRRPRSYIFLADHIFTDFTMTFRAKTLEPPETIWRDVVVIFGYVDDTHYYYAHISSLSDNRVHNIIMKVMGDTREMILNENTPPVQFTGDWNDIKVEKKANGHVAIYVNDMENPMMTADDVEYPAGSVAIGCFDDRGLFDDISIEGTFKNQLDVSVMGTPGVEVVQFQCFNGLQSYLDRSADLLNWTNLIDAGAEQTTIETYQSSETPLSPTYYRTRYNYPTMP